MCKITILLFAESCCCQMVPDGLLAQFHFAHEQICFLREAFLRTTWQSHHYRVLAVHQGARTPVF